MNSAEPHHLDEIERLSYETGMPVSDLQTLAKLGIHGAYLLRRRMLILGIDPDSFSLSQPTFFRELQKSCSACQDHEVCGHDLIRGAVDPLRQDWREYCPNAGRLRAISMLENC
jgi:hypothetical protein